MISIIYMHLLLTCCRIDSNKNLFQVVNSFSIHSFSSSKTQITGGGGARRLSINISQSSSALQATQQQRQETKSKKSSRTTTIPIIACSSNIELQRAISLYIKPNDSVLELGSQLNDISTYICERVFESSSATTTTTTTATDTEEKGEQVVVRVGGIKEKETYGKQGNVLHVDIKRKDASSGRCQPRNFDTFIQRFNNNINNSNRSNYQINFQELDSFDQWRNLLTATSSSTSSSTDRTAQQQQQQQQQTTYDVMILDIGTMIGNDLHLTSLSIANEFIAYQQRLNSQNNNNNNINDNHHHHHQPRVILIKSKIVSNLARRLIHSQRLLTDKSTTFPKPNDIPRSNTPYIIASVGVNEYRRTIPFIVQSGDCILEVGCHFGQSTVILHDAASISITKRSKESESDDDNVGNEEEGDHVEGGNNNGFCIGVDIGPKIIQHAKDKYPNVPFYVGNAWNILQLLKFRQTYDMEQQEQEEQQQNSNDNQRRKRTDDDNKKNELGYDLVYADIGGLSGSDGLLESLSLLDSIGQGLEPRCIVIKSLCMNRLASQLKAFTDIWSKIEQMKE